MDLFHRLRRILQARLAPQEKSPLLSDYEPWMDAIDDNDVRSQAGPTAGDQRSKSPQDPLLATWYANLEIPYGSDLETVKKAWRRLMKRYHPDLHGADLSKKEIATELTRKLTEAYKELEKRLD